jgi:hypothetical protein
MQNLVKLRKNVRTIEQSAVVFLYMGESMRTHPLFGKGRFFDFFSVQNVDLD